MGLDLEMGMCVWMKWRTYGPYSTSLDLFRGLEF